MRSITFYEQWWKSDFQIGLNPVRAALRDHGFVTGGKKFVVVVYVGHDFVEAFLRPPGLRVRVNIGVRTTGFS